MQNIQERHSPVSSVPEDGEYAPGHCKFCKHNFIFIVLFCFSKFCYSYDKKGVLQGVS